VPQAVIDQDLPCIASLQHDFTEAPENIEERPRFAAAHLFKNGLKAIPRDIPWTEHSFRSPIERESHSSDCR
jgi:hypothetical protein